MTFTFHIATFHSGLYSDVFFEDNWKREQEDLRRLQHYGDHRDAAGALSPTRSEAATDIPQMQEKEDAAEPTIRREHQQIVSLTGPATMQSVDTAPYKITADVLRSFLTVYDSEDFHWYRCCYDVTVVPVRNDIGAQAKILGHVHSGTYVPCHGREFRFHRCQCAV